MFEILALALLLLAAAPAQGSRSLAQANATTLLPATNATANATTFPSPTPTNGTLAEDPLVNPFTGRTLVPFLPANSDSAGGVQEQPPRAPVTSAPINQVGASVSQAGPSSQQ
jgi:hypothetical protein